MLCVCLIFLSAKKKPVIVDFTVDTAQLLSCSPGNNLPISWRFADSVLYPDPRHIVVSQGLIVTPSYSDAGLYSCETVEAVKGRVHKKTVVQYLVRVHDTNGTIRNLKVALIALAVIAGLLIVSKLGPVVIGLLNVATISAITIK